MKRTTLLFSAILLFTGLAQAVPVTWTIAAGSTFADGTAISGSFVYDVTTNTYSAVAITTLPGTLPGATFTASHFSPGFSSSGVLIALTPLCTGLLNCTDTPVLVLSFGAALTNAGGAVTLLTTGYQGTCLNAGCTTPQALRRQVAAGSSIGGVPPPATGVPTLSQYGMAGLGMLLAAGGVLLIRRQNSLI